MTYNFLLDALCDLCRSATENFSLPEQMQRDDNEPSYRAPAVHKMRLPDSRSYKKEAPYIIVQFLTANKNIARVRIICGTQSENESEGCIALLNVMDAIYLAICKRISIGESYTVVRDENGDPEIEMLVYPDDTRPFYGGEISLQINCPAVDRQYSFITQEL